ncbi:hypothetical protein N9023_05835 [Opitutaceae bacterium]|nr:hypothetical protein [Opitutaceae bacterium]MDB4474511.1 hypothetical protein [Opitutaceae bacterium]
MNSSESTPRPRLVCRLARRGNRAEKSAQPNWRDRHVDSCADCAGYFNAAEAMEAELRESAPSSPASVPAGLEDRIWAAVEADQATAREATPSQARMPGWRNGFTLAGVALVAAIFVWSSNSSGPDKMAVAHTDFSEQDMQVLVAQIGDFSAKWLSPQSEVTGGLETSPLAAELDALEADASAALRFLERSFLPTRRSAS